jgi:hypothetical protein
MQRRKPRVYLMPDWSRSDYRLVIVEDAAPGKISVANGFTWSEHEEGGLFDGQEGIAQSSELVQALMDRAWEAGFRPAGFSDVKNETAAIKGHLEDMRAIAFHKIGIKK